MEDLIIQIEEEEHDKPYVNFQAGSGMCELSGESFPEKTADFYERLMSWLEQYMKEVKGPINFTIKLTYFNTSSSKRILHLMMKLQEYVKDGAKVKARWIYHPDDIDLEEDIEDLRSIAKLDLEMVKNEDLQFKGLEPDE